MKKYPLTKGLLVSMAYRKDHSYGLDSQGNLFFGHTNESRIEIIKEMKELYDSQDDPIEANGKGFYSPEKEDYYLNDWPKNFEPNWFTKKISDEIENLIKNESQKN